MAITSIRSTYALDVDSVRALEGIARRWNVSKSEALRRAIRAAAAQASQGRSDALDTLDELQRSLHVTPAKARAWARRTRAERQASSARADPAGR